MTKNNLKQHLRWLVDRGQPDFAALDVLLTRPDVDASNTQIPPQPLLEAPRPIHTEELTITLDENSIAILKKNEDLGLKVDSDGDCVLQDATMARLNLASSSASKPRMLSITAGNRSDNARPLTPGSDVRKNSGSDRPKVGDISYRSASAAIISSPSRRKRNVTPTKLGPILSSDYKSHFDDIESIDLTGDVEQTTSSGTVEAFGDSQTLWREDCAMRPEPLPKQGKKRKSDEYQSDLGSPRRNSPRLKASHLPGDDDDDDDVSVADITPTISSDPPSYDITSSQELARQSPVRSAVSKKPTTTTTPTSKSRTKRDSQEDLDPNLFSWDSDEDAFEPLPPKRIRPSERGLNPRDSNRAPNAETTPQPDVIQTQPKFTSPKKLSPKKVSPKKRQAIVDTVASTPLSQITPNPKVEHFLSLNPAAVDGAIEKLNKALVANAAVVVQHAIEGELPPHEVVAEGKAARVKVDALGKVKLERASYDEKKSRKQQLKDMMVKAVADGEDLTGLAAEIKESQDIVKDLQGIEARLSDLLSIIDMDLSAFTPPPQFGDLGNTVLPATPQTLVRPVAQPIPQRFQTETPPIVPSNSRAASLTTSYRQDVSTFQEGNSYSTGIPSNAAAPFITSDDFDFDEEDFLETDNVLSTGLNEAPATYSDNRRIFAETSGNSSRQPQPTQKPTVPDPNSMLSFAWSKDVRTVMRDRFHLKGFRPNQLEAINATLGGKDAFVLMPTGGGKSLCYQLPSVIHSGRTKGVTIVVSPLLSLMEDQVDHLQKLGIKAFFINGDVTPEHKRWVMSALSSPFADRELELLYVTPEMVNKNLTLRDILKTLHANRKLARLVIDEAHCVSQWGHDFRPDYKELGSFRSEFPGIPVMALTATATENVKIDVINNLRMKGCEVLSQSFNRPNLTYDVLPKKGSAPDIISQIADIIQTSYKRKAGIVYCLSRKDCEKVAQELSKGYKIKATHYHAGMASAERTAVQRDWQSGKYDVIVATIAFGMGIDKPDVRFVIHHTMPKSLEGYYQETGRAGRDGKRSGCYLFYSYRDTAAQKRFIEQSDGDWQQKNRQRQMLRHVVQFCENQSDCRRVQILAYFNESFRAGDCHRTCDNCKTDETFQTVDFSDLAKQAIQLVRLFNDRDEDVTILHCIDIFAGTFKRMKGDHAQLPQYGVGHDIELGDVERLFFKLVGEDILEEWSKTTSRFTHRYVKLGPKASQFLSAKSPFTMQVRASSKSAKRASGTVSTGMSGASDYHPQSTNVPSPVQASRRKATPKAAPKAKGKRGAVKAAGDDDDSDGFEPVRVAGKSNRRKKAEVGPPIVQDDRLAELDDNQQMVVEDFVTNAKELSQQIMMERNLRNQPFPDAILREMAIYLPEDTNQMKEIPEINQDKVDRYGSRFLKLIRNSKQLLSDMRANNEVIHDPNHTNVINLDSDDEYGDDEDFMFSLSQLDPDDQNTSQYFGTSASTQTRVPSTQFTDLDAPSTTSRRTTSKASSAPRSRARGGAQRTSSGSSSRRRKPWIPEAYTYTGGSAKRSYKSYNSRSRGSSSSGYSTYRRSSSTTTANKRKTSARPSVPQIDLMPT
ncbi:RecQ family helicase MusN [Talaromyces stipitatus ATCC 10500]|uniref:RecQ-like DNA helicase BLM n=1 Tax=Talaromyces stipitatus (strain ATCC 10500 / CBS 375.48 / QM 6759 / NRRL 1006) TaxID=441959 RepID=B8LYU5_TALSN|nr:RecQ family helicase MusN [Talaromyces stipitatus ATCC 10500]EED23453.1 RecQ family helicase MusN [Talaromyces stipitatus ATCC 10500]